VKTIITAGATKTTGKEIDDASLSGAEAAKKAIEAAKKRLKDEISKYMKGYKVDDVEQEMKDMFDRGGIEQGLYAESYKAALKIKDFIKGLEDRLDDAKEVKDLKEEYDKAKEDAKEITKEMQNILDQYL